MESVQKSSHYLFHPKTHMERKSGGAATKYYTKPEPTPEDIFQKEVLRCIRIHARKLAMIEIYEQMKASKSSPTN